MSELTRPLPKDNSRNNDDENLMYFSELCLKYEYFFNLMSGNYIRKFNMDIPNQSIPILFNIYYPNLIKFTYQDIPLNHVLTNRFNKIHM